MSRPLRARRGGSVYLIGAGPGDPGLITVKGLQKLRSADVVMYDALVNPALLEEAPFGSERICVGKRGGGHGVAQDTINALLVGRARAGSTVVRLKGGDPFVFGRGGEECEALHAAGIPFEIIPGVTSAVAVPAFAGIPVTHRRYASAFAVVTGHECDGASDLDWEALSRLPTLVVLMGLHRLREITRRLMAHGADPTTPAAVVTDGTSPLQRTVTGTIATIAALTEEASLQPPGIIVIGKVAELHNRLRWFGLPAEEEARGIVAGRRASHHLTPPAVSVAATGRRRSGTAKMARLATRTVPAMK